MHDYNVLFKQYITQYSAKSDLSQAIIFIIKNFHIFIFVNIPLLMYKYLIRLLSNKENPYYNLNREIANKS